MFGEPAQKGSWVVGQREGLGGIGEAWLNGEVDQLQCAV